MELSLRLSFYLRHSLGGYTVGTIVGFPVEIVEALAPQSCRRIPWKCPQYHVSTCSTHCRVTGSSNPLDGGLTVYCRGNVPRVPWATGYGPKFWIRSVPSSGKQLGSHTPRIRKLLHHSRLKKGAGGGTNLKRTNLEND
jgi:hypothetical protein